MKKLLFAFLLTVSSLMAEQKLVYFTGRVVGIDELNYNRPINDLLKDGWVIKQISVAGVGSAMHAQIAVLLERKIP